MKKFHFLWLLAAVMILLNAYAGGPSEITVQETQKPETVRREIVSMPIGIIEWE